MRKRSWEVSTFKIGHCTRIPASTETFSKSSCVTGTVKKRMGRKNDCKVEQRGLNGLGSLLRRKKFAYRKESGGGKHITSKEKRRVVVIRCPLGPRRVQGVKQQFQLRIPANRKAKNSRANTKTESKKGGLSGC